MSEALLLHFQQLVNSLKVLATAKCKVQCFLKFLTKRDIMQFAALLHDVVSALSVMSQVFQRKVWCPLPRSHREHCTVHKF